MSTRRPAGRIRQLFATPLVIDELPDANEINPLLEGQILAKRAEDQGLKLSNRGGWQSQHDFVRWSGDAGRTVIKHAVQLASACAQRVDGTPPRWAIEAWANVGGPGAFNMPHIHGGTYWSAVYYVRIGDGDGGELVLHDPRMPGLRMHAPQLRFRNIGPDVKVKILPKEGLMLLFPGWLSHSVEPWSGSGQRISIAMNIRAGPV